MQVGASHQSAWGSSTQLFVIGGSTASRETLTTQFEHRQYDIECVEANQVADQMQLGLPAGVVFLEQYPDSAFLDVLPPDATDIPQIAVGKTFDSPAQLNPAISDVLMHLLPVQRCKRPL